MDFTPLNVTFAILGISLLVVVHESGHYLAARAFGMRVLKYSIGLGKPIWKHKPKNSDTTFQVCMLPLLAYVQIDGMNPADDVDPKDPALYPNKGVFARIVTIFAGPFANYLAASVLIFGLAQVGGLPEEGDATNEVASVQKGSPAQLAKLRAGDELIEVNGAPIEAFDDLVVAHEGRDGQETEYIVLRDGERMTVMLTPELAELAGGARPVIGVRLVAHRVFRTHPMDEAFEAALKLPLAVTIAQVEGIWGMIQRPDPTQVKSVVGMTKMLSDSIRVAPQQYVWYLILISIALGFFNLLPVPALDGGRLTFLAYELITRRRANERVEAAVHTVGLLLLLGILALVVVQDVIDLT